MFRGLMVAVVFACASGVWAVDIEWIMVGSSGDVDDIHGEGYGGVDYVYAIGKFEVTAGQYTEFLNAVAADDTYGLYNNDMDVSVNQYGCNIIRNGSPGSYGYSVAPDWASRPVNNVSWGDAVRFANWLHNGQPTGAQGPETTEEGAYILDGATSSAALFAVTREPDALVFIPSEDEWYKAAYYDGSAGVYYDFPTGTDAVPTFEPPAGTDMVNGSANHQHALGSPYHRTVVGAYNARPSDSPCGTFDQGGNVREWNEAGLPGLLRGVRGGSFGGGDPYNLHAENRNGATDPTVENGNTGFRVAAVYEPVPAVSPWSLLALSALIACSGIVVLRRVS